MFCPTFSSQQHPLAQQMYFVFNTLFLYDFDQLGCTDCTVSSSCYPQCNIWQYLTLLLIAGTRLAVRDPATHLGWARLAAAAGGEKMKQTSGGQFGDQRRGREWEEEPRLSFCRGRAPGAESNQCRLQLPSYIHVCIDGTAQHWHWGRNIFIIIIP